MAIGLPDDYGLHAEWYLDPPCLEVVVYRRRRRSLRSIISRLWRKVQGQ